ncbi:enoyl-CoA hydratase [Moraxella atlantae]|uniref:Enoyl-CoA hydratase n=1 Tax=Faucicola atlantae TaxID=34059 RepID=A0A1B8QCI1_9GAMM|nr:enoyl-CoA hydratase [Moraxella atlantae]
MEITLTDTNVLTVWLNRTDKRNALSFAMMDQLVWLAQTLATWRDVRAVIIGGRGASFCAGIDLADLNQSKHLPMLALEFIKPTASRFQRVCLCWRDLPMPVIAVTHGHCLGAGLQLALACDIRLSAPNCQFAIMEAKWGLVPDMGLTQSALGVVRADVLKELAMTARVFDATAAQDYGIITHISDDPMRDAHALAAELATRSPDAVLASKRVVNAMYAQSANVLHQEKIWQLKLLIGNNRRLALKKAKDHAVKFLPRQFS